jgi:hypothetical protein
MSVERNTITCDGHDALPVVLVIPDVSVRFVIPARVRTCTPMLVGEQQKGELDHCERCSDRSGHERGGVIGARPSASQVMATPSGPLPTVTVFTTLLVEVLMTLTVSEPSLVT